MLTEILILNSLSDTVEPQSSTVSEGTESVSGAPAGAADSWKPWMSPLSGVHGSCADIAALGDGRGLDLEPKWLRSDGG